MARHRLFYPTLGILAGVLFLAAMGLGLEGYLDGRVVPGVSLYGYDLGLFPVGDAAGIVEEVAEDVETAPVQVYYARREWRLVPRDLGVSVDRDALLESVYQVGRQGNFLERLRERFVAWRHGRELPLVLAIDEEKRDQALQALAQGINKRPRNATMDLDTRRVFPGETGLELDESLSWLKIKEMVKSPLKEPVPLEVREVEPATTAADISALGELDVLSRATTVFDRSEENRVTNIRVAAGALDGVLLEPDQVLSFNQVVGPRKPEYGFMEAPELVDLELVPGYGGGICQVSSTLYNAALLAGLEIVERANHSRPSDYIPMGLDAAVAYDYLDLKLRNPTVSPRLIVARIQEDRIDVAILGKWLTPERYHLERGPIEEIDPPREEITDPTLLPGEYLEEEEGAPGYRVKMERVVTLDGREIRREEIGVSEYKPRPHVIRIGPVE